MKIHRYRIHRPIQLSYVSAVYRAIHTSVRQPNIVFILIDDLSHYGVLAYGAVELNSTQGFFDPVRSPRRKSTDWLKRVLAGNAFAYPICEPTRVALMTGMNNHRNFVRAKALHESQITFGDLFKKAGYTTGIAGKWKQSRGTGEIRAKTTWINLAGMKFIASTTAL